MSYLAPKKHLLKHSRLLEMLRYDPKDGNFYTLTEAGNKTPLGRISGTRRKKDGRRIIYLDKIAYFASRLAWFYMTKNWPKNFIDHINRDPKDDRWCNLREATYSQNRANSACPPSKLGIRGIRIKRKKYEVRIKVNKKQMTLGYYDHISDAFSRRLRASAYYFGEFARA